MTSAMATDNRPALNGRLEQAFPVQAGPPASIVEHAPCDECDAVSAALAGRKWTEVNWDPVLESTLPLLSPEAFGYYLPAFLRHGLVSEASDDPVTVFLAHRAASADDLSFWAARINRLTPAQIGALRTYLRLMGSEDEWPDPAQQAEKFVAAVLSPEGHTPGNG